MSTARVHQAEHDPRTAPGICGVTRVIGGTEWICIKPVHAKTYERHARGRRGQVVEDQNPNADRHHFVNRHPWREEPHDD